MRPDQHVAGEPNVGAIEHDAAEVQVHLLVQRDVLAVVAIERRLDPGPVAAAAEQFASHGAPHVLVVLTSRAVARRQIAGPRAATDEVRIPSLVQFARAHPISLRSRTTGARLGWVHWPPPAGTAAARFRDGVCRAGCGRDCASGLEVSSRASPERGARSLATRPVQPH